MAEETRPRDRRKARCDTIIHTASAAAAAGGGLSVVPGSDALIIMPIQVLMIVRLAREYGVRLSSTLARSAAYATLAQILGKGSSRILASFVPGLGNVIRAGVAFTITQAIGRAVVEQLDSGDLG